MLRVLLKNVAANHSVITQFNQSAVPLVCTFSLSHSCGKYTFGGNGGRSISTLRHGNQLQLSNSYSALQGSGLPSLVRSPVPVGYVEQRRNYWGKEGRIAWRRKRAIERWQRERILNPVSPVVDNRVPWPKDDTESLPEDLFGKPKVAISAEEEFDTKNAVIQNINNQVGEGSEGRLFAVIHVAGKQFKVTPEDIIVIQEYFTPVPGDQIRFHKILLVGGKDFTLVGRPMIDQDLVRIEGTVIEKTLSYTKMHFRMDQQYRRTKFMKTPYTMIRINLIKFLKPLEMFKTEADSMKFVQQQL